MQGCVVAYTAAVNPCYTGEVVVWSSCCKTAFEEMRRVLLISRAQRGRLVYVAGALCSAVSKSLPPALPARTYMRSDDTLRGCAYTVPQHTTISVDFNIPATDCFVPLDRPHQRQSARDGSWTA